MKPVWLAIKIVVGVAGVLAALGGLALGAFSVLSSLLGASEMPLGQGLATAVAMVALGVGLGVPLAWQGFNAALGRPSRRFGAWTGFVLLALFIPAVALGAFSLWLGTLGAVCFPFLHIIAAIAPPLGILALAAATLSRAGFRWRDAVLNMTSSGLFLIIGLIVIELVLAVVLAVVVLGVYIVVTPGGMVWAETTLAHLQDEVWLSNPDNLLSLTMEPAVMFWLALLFVAIIPPLEELFKPLGAIALMFYKRPTRAEAFLWGLACGVGFAIAESLFNGLLSVEAWPVIVTMRIGASAMHCMGSALIALGFQRLRVEHKPWKLMGAYAFAVVVHGLWNLASVSIMALSVSGLAPGLAETISLAGGLGLMLLTVFVVMVIAYFAVRLRQSLPTQPATEALGWE